MLVHYLWQTSQEINNRQEWVWGIWEFFILSLQFVCKSKTFPKQNVYLKPKKKQKALANICKV